jgi:hypothetical protein
MEFTLDQNVALDKVKALIEEKTVIATSGENYQYLSRST